MEIATIKRGESFTFKVVLNAEYDMARLKEYYLYIGGRAMTGTVNGNAITVKLRSEDTDLMSGINKITLWLDDTILGVQKPYLGDMVVSMTNADESNTSVSEVDNALIPVTITATAITVGDIMYNYVIGRSAYQVWLDAGNEGTVEDYLTALKGEQGADGVGLNYLGTVATSANLNPSYEGIANDAFVTEDLGRACKWTGTQWLDVGSFRGEKGDPFLYEDFTPEQIEALKVKGDKGDPFLYEDFTPEQLEALKGDTGNGIQSITLLSTVGLVKTYRITYTNGTTYDYTVTDGAGGGGGVDLSAYLTELEAQGLYQPIGAYLTSETDPTVPAWAKEATKPTYTAAEVGAAATGHTHTDLHTHSNKSVLDATTASFTLTDESKLDGLSNYTHPATHSISEVSGLQAELDSKADTIHNHDDRYYTEGEVDELISAIKGAYDAELVTSPTTGTLTLKNSTETVLDGALTTSNVFTVALPTPVSGKVNESVLIFKIGASLPTITQPSGIVWRGKVPTLAINTNWTIVYEQVNTTGTTYEIWAVATKNA